MRKKRLIKRLIVVFLLASLMLLSMSTIYSPALAKGEGYEGDGNNLDLSTLQVGDIILTKGVKKYADLVGGAFPGYWHHASLYIGNGEIIEAWPGGVRKQPVSITLTADEAAIYRVNTSGTVKNTAVNFVKNQLGKPYDYSWLVWPGGKSTSSYYWYCSELAWAAYKVNGVEIDANPGYHWLYWNNVAPGEIADASTTYKVAHAK